MEQLVPIGQFAMLTQLSMKALLRLYGENGILPPARIDPDSGYRYYRIDQVPRARLVRLLRDADMPLARIGEMLREPSVEGIDAYIADLEARHAERLRVLRYLRRLLNPEEFVMGFEVKVKETPAQPYVGRTATVSVMQLESFIQGSIRELSTGVEPAGPAFTLFYGPVTDEEDGRVEVGVPIAEAREGSSTLPAGPVAYTVAVGAQTDYPDILGAYDAVVDWMKRHGHEMAGPSREIYHFEEGAAVEDRRMEIAWPIR